VLWEHRCIEERGKLEERKSGTQLRGHRTDGREMAGRMWNGIKKNRFAYAGETVLEQ
jgi:hypothetical protein